MQRRPNYLAGLGSLVWLFRDRPAAVRDARGHPADRSDYSSSGPLAFPKHLTLHNYTQDFSNGFGHFFLNTLVVTIAVVPIVLLLVPPLAYAIVRSRGRITDRDLPAVPAGAGDPRPGGDRADVLRHQQGRPLRQPDRRHPADRRVLLPVCALILTGVMRDISTELYEAMAHRRRHTRRVFFQLVVPLSKSGLSTIVVFSALQAWNGFLFPLVLTQSDAPKVITLGLFNFQTQHGVTSPACWPRSCCPCSPSSSSTCSPVAP